MVHCVPGYTTTNDNILWMTQHNVVYKFHIHNENPQLQSCKVLIGLTIRAKMIGGDVPFYVKIWRILTDPLQNADFQSIFVYSASALTPSKKFN